MDNIHEFTMDKETHDEIQRNVMSQVKVKFPDVTEDKTIITVIPMEPWQINYKFKLLLLVKTPENKFMLEYNYQTVDEIVKSSKEDDLLKDTPVV